LDKRPGDTAFVAYKNAVATMTALHANFRLSGDGEYLGLFHPQGILLDEIMYCTQASDVSYGRSTRRARALALFWRANARQPNSLYGSVWMETPGEPVFSLARRVLPNPAECCT
jgi:hypothetical protein